MQNVIDLLKSLINEHVIENPNTPLHTGEVMNIWSYYTFVNEARSFGAMAMNHTDNKELLHALEDIVYNLEDPQISKVEEFLKTNGISLPDVNAKKPISDPRAVPLGAKMTDTEIANGVAVKISGAIMFCSRGMVESVRDDVGVMFTGFHVQLMLYGLKMKKFMKKNGWLLVPPYYYAPGAPYQEQ